MSQRHYNTGFTVIELMIVLVILGVISAMAYPSVQGQIENMKLRNDANIIEAALKQARADALVYRADVSVNFTGHTLRITQSSDPNYLQVKKLETALPSAQGATLVFTPNKSVRVLPDSAVSGMSVCIHSTDEALDKYVVKVDRLSNISQFKVEEDRSTKRTSCPK